MIAYASDGASYGLGLLPAVHPAHVRDGVSSARRCACASARSPTAATASSCSQRYGPRVGLVRRRRPDAHQPRDADRRVRRDPRRPRLLPPRLRRRRRRSGCRSSLFTLSGGRYWRWERIVLGLALFNGLFLVAAILVTPHWAASGSVRHVSPLPGRQLQHAAAADRLDDRRDRDAVDDLLPAERLRRQGHDPARPRARAATTRRRRRCSPRSSASARWSPARRCSATTARGIQGFAGAGVPGGAATRRRRRRRRRCSRSG